MPSGDKLTFSVKIGKSYKNKVWTLNRESLLPLLPYSSYEKSCDLLIDEMPAKGRLNLLGRIYINSNEKEVIDHLERLHNFNSEDRIELTLLLNKDPKEKTWNELYYENKILKDENTKLKEDNNKLNLIFKNISGIMDDNEF